MYQIVGLFFVFLIGLQIEPQNAYYGNSYIRLEHKTKPLQYWLKVIPNFHELIYKGDVTIEIIVKESTNKIMLLCNYVEIDDVQLLDDKGTEVNKSINIIEHLGILNIYTAKNLTVERTYKIRVAFHNDLFFRKSGFFLSYYLENTGKKLAALTHMEPTRARFVFPCYDEPEFKAKFTISVARQSYEICHSNMPLAFTSKKDPNVGDRVWDTFQTTPPIPTHLVAFMNTEFENVNHPNKKISILMRKKGYQHDTIYGLQEAARILSKMEDYTSLPYPLPKLDLVAVPFYLRKMENLGLVLMDESLLLYDDQICPSEKREEISRSITFATAGQWFGSYAVLRWWDYLWVKKGLMKYLEYHLKAMIDPSWRLDELFMAKIQTLAFYEDANDFKPLFYEVTTPDDIDDKFNSISFLKGASFYKMMEQIVTPLTFHKAIKKFFLQGKDKGNFTTQDDLTSIIENQVRNDKIELNFPKGYTITSFVNDWTTSIGHPIIYVNRVSSGSDNFDNIIVSQKIFVGHRTGNWSVPITYAKKSDTKFNTRPSMWSFTNTTITLNEKVKKDEWILFNLQRLGFYRVNYDLKNWYLLIKQFHTSYEKIPILNRIQLIDDSFNVALKQMTNMRVPLELISYIKSETDGIPLIASIKTFYQFRNEINHVNAFDEFFISCLEYQFRRLGFKPKSTDDHVTTITRRKINYVLCKFDSEECVAHARVEYKKNVNHLHEIHPELKLIVLCTEVRYNSSAKDEIKKMAKNTDLACELELLIRAYFCYDDPVDTIDNLNTLLRNYSHVNKEVIKEIFEEKFTNERSITYALQFIDKIISNLRYEELNTDQTEIIIILAQSISHKMRSEEQVKIVRKIFNKMKTLEQGKFKKLTSSVEKSLNSETKYESGIDQDELNYILGTEGYCLTPYDIVLPQTI